MSRRSVLGLLLVFVILLFRNVSGQYDVPYEPSSPEIVERMLKMASVSGKDTVYDLGCGDGRIVIAAVKKYGAAGVGVDIDPVRIKESTENAAKEKVVGRIRFIEKNLFEADIHEATVVTLFLWPEVNLKLRPKLFRDLRPGTRIVSHEHDMGEWSPDRATKVVAKDWNHRIFLWVLPANVSGTWTWTTPVGGVEKRYTLNLKQRFQKVGGALTIDSTEIPLRDISLDGKKLSFAFEDAQHTMFLFEGSADGDAIEGTVRAKTGSKPVERTWKASRDPSTVLPIDE